VSVVRYLVTGSNRGIGLALVGQILDRGGSVEATARDPERATALKHIGRQAHRRLGIHACDIASDESVEALGRLLAGVPIDVVINNAGVFGNEGALDALDFADALRAFDVNALGALRVTRTLLPNLRLGSRKLLLHITSGMGSIADNASGGYYGYRMSKAALNMASKSIAIDFAHVGITSVVVNPGWVKTDMGGDHAPLDVADSASHLMDLIDRRKFEDSGAFFDRTGERYPW